MSERAKLYEVLKSATVAQVETIEFIRLYEVEADFTGDGMVGAYLGGDRVPQPLA